jgi:glyoxylase-like metal-dependent hydrolase (beta-lactamase superfamily II)
VISRRRWLKIAGVTATSVLTLPFAPKAQTGGQGIYQHASPRQGLYSNSYLIEGANSCVLVDAHLNKDEAAELARFVVGVGKPLEAIIVTHPHPDHYLGLQYLMPRWPMAVVRSAEVSLEIIRTVAADWGPFSNPLVPVEEGTLTLASREFECMLPPDAESVAPVVLYEADSKTLVAGDHLLNSQHLWLVEGRLEAWRRNLENISSKWPVETVLPGHGAVGGQELFTSTDTYLSDFMDLMSQGLTATKLRQEMLRRYPYYVFTEALDSSIRVLT